MGNRRGHAAIGRQGAARLSPGHDRRGSNLRNFWLLGLAPFPEAHFATFPPRIPEIAILAGTSAKGVCPKCGAPWERVTSTSYEKGSGSAGGRRREADPRDARKDRLPKLLRHDETIGWRPTCGCDMHPALPATVLDPFLGSGTTALVADRLGRDCIGIELSPKYAAMARRRLADDAGMFAAVAD